MLKLKYQRAVLIIVEAYIVYLFVYAWVKRGLPDNPIYWIAAIIEVGLAFLVNFILYKYVYYRKYEEWKKRYSFMAFLIMVIAIGVPHVFGFTNLAGLRLIGGTFWWFLLAGVSIGLYRSFRRPVQWRKMHEEQLMTRVRIFYTVVLSLVLIAGLVVIILTTLGIWPLLESRVPSFAFLVSGSFFVFSVLSVIFGLYWPRLSGWFYKRLMISSTVDVEAFYDFAGQCGSFMYPAIMGFIIGMMVGVWYTWLPFFALSVAMLVTKFPTNARLNQCIQRRSSSGKHFEKSQKN